MVDKYKKCDFGRCPRVICEGQGLLPMGLNDCSGVKSVKLYCARYVMLPSPYPIYYPSLSFPNHIQPPSSALPPFCLVINECCTLRN